MKISHEYDPDTETKTVSIDVDMDRIVIRRPTYWGDEYRQVSTYIEGVHVESEIRKVYDSMWTPGNREYKTAKEAGRAALIYRACLTPAIRLEFVEVSEGKVQIVDRLTGNTVCVLTQLLEVDNGNSFWVNFPVERRMMIGRAFPTPEEWVSHVEMPPVPQFIIDAL